MPALALEKQISVMVSSRWRVEFVHTSHFLCECHMLCQAAMSDCLIHRVLHALVRCWWLGDRTVRALIDHAAEVITHGPKTLPPRQATVSYRG